MNHLDQHTLELYVLDSDELELSSRQIERHLAECAGCRELHEEISQYYRRAEENYVRSEEPPEGRALVWQSPARAVTPFRDSRTPLRPIPRSLASLVRTLRRHPVVTGAGILAAGSALWGLSLLHPLTRDRNPSFGSLNAASSKLEVYNRSNQLLWDIPVTGIGVAREGELRDHLPRVVISDLDGDGRNEVIATLESVGGSAAHKVSNLFVLSPEREILAHVSGYGTIRFNGEEFSDVHLYGGLIVQDFTGDGKKEILCRAFSGRSPMGILRYDRAGRLLGQYWHFGHLTQMILVGPGARGGGNLLLGGSNDAGEGDFGSAVVLLLDPQKIQGETEASATPGFGYLPSRAEEVYLLLPNTSLNTRYRSKPGISGVFLDETGPEFHIWWTATLPDGRLDVEYILGSDLTIRSVKSSDNTTRLLTLLRKRGEISPDEAERFLPSLRAAARYWDGKSWRKERFALRSP